MKYITLFVALLATFLTGCVTAKTEDGALVTRFSRFADEAEVDAVAKRVDGVETALATERTERTDADVAIRSDVKAADDAAGLAFQTALSEGKTASEAMGAATAAAAAKAQADATAAMVKSVKAAADAEEARKARDEIDSGIVGKLGIEEILAMLGITGTGGVVLNTLRNRTRAKTIAKVAVKPGTPPVV